MSCGYHSHKSSSTNASSSSSMRDENSKSTEKSVNNQTSTPAPNKKLKHNNKGQKRCFYKV